MRQNIQNKKVCVLTSVHKCDDVRIYVKEARSLAAAGYETVILSPYARETDDLGIRFVTLKKYEGRVKRILCSPFSILGSALREQADVYHLHDPELLPTGLLLKLRGKKVIFDAHEDVPKQILNKYWISPPVRKTIAWTFEKLLHFSAHRFDWIIAATAGVEERYLRYGCSTAVVNNYPLLSEFESVDVPWAGRRNALCYVGGIMKVRGILELLHVLEKTNCTLELAGSFENNALEEEARASVAWDKVNFHGFIGRTEVASLLAEVKLGMVTLHPIPNYIDSLPIKMFEYMAAGIPVIASNFPLWQEIVEGNGCGLCVDPFDIEGTATAVTELLGNDERAAQMGENGKKAVRDQYNWQPEEAKLLALYAQLFKGKEEAV